MKRSSSYAIATAVVLLSLFPVRSVDAAELSAKSVVRTTDPVGDVPYCKGDVVSADADWTDARLRFEITTQCGMDLGSDPSWTVGLTGAGAVVDINGDAIYDYAAIYDSETPGVLFNAGGGVVCNGSAGHPTATSYVLEFASGCVPGPFTFVAGMVFDEDPYGDTCDCPLDAAPDASWAGPVNRTSPPPPPPPVNDGRGYWMLGRDGDVYAFGAAAVYGTHRQAGHAVDLEPTPSGRGYWIVDESGNVGTHGDASSFGSLATGQLRPLEAVTAISRTATGNGYWLFTNLGRVLCFGDAAFFGDMSQTKLNGPVLDAIPTPSGSGYYMVGSDGGIFTFGDAVFQGSMGSVRLNAPVQSLVPDPDRVGYWLVASDGGIFAFEAEFYGSMGSTKLNRPVTGMVGFGRGYLMVAEDGGIFTFGDAPFFGSLGDRPPAVPIVSTAILNP